MAEVNIDEMKTFLGIVMWMGLTSQPSLASYWSKSYLYRSEIPKYMTRNRFEIILKTFHCSNNAECPPGDGLFKIRNLVDLLVIKFKMWNVPSENMCSDESVKCPVHGQTICQIFV